MAWLTDHGDVITPLVRGAPRLDLALGPTLLGPDLTAAFSLSKMLLSHKMCRESFLNIFVYSVFTNKRTFQLLKCGCSIKPTHCRMFGSGWYYQPI